MHAASQFTNDPYDNTIILNKTGFKIVDPSGLVICQNSKLPSDKVWMMPSSTTSSTPHTNYAVANLFIKNEPNAVFVAYMSACFFNPTDTTFEKAARRGWFGNLPRLTGTMIAANLPHSQASSFGHLDRLRQNLRSTKTPTPTPTPTPTSTPTPTPTPITIPTTADLSDELDDLIDPIDPDELLLKTFDVTELSDDDKKTLSIYFDATGMFPFDSIDGEKYIFITVYKNYIHAEPMTDRSATSYIPRFRSAIEFFRSKGHLISSARLDNETSALLEKFFTQEAKIPFQYITAGSHRANKAERAIRSWKNHFIAGISSVDSSFPMHQWPKLIPQANITINLLRPSSINPLISAYKGIFNSDYDFLAHPIAPPGIKVTVYEPSDNRTSWNPHGVSGYYLGPALQHYRNMVTYIPETNGIRMSDQIDYFPTKFLFPGASTAEILIAAIDNLKLSLNSSNAVTPELETAAKALTDAVTTFKLNTPPIGPKSPDTLTPTDLNLIPTAVKRVQFLDPPFQVTEISTPLAQSPERVNLDTHQLRPVKHKRKIADNYRKLTAKEASAERFVQLKIRTGQRFIDTEDTEEFQIDSVVMPNITSGAGSKTPFYKLFNVKELCRAKATRQYDYTPCSEINEKKSKYVQWVPRTATPTALAVQSTSPRDINRALNQTYEGQPLNFKKAMALDPDLWFKCDVEEWDRLMDKTLLPIQLQCVPRGETISYYNKQIKEKEVFVNDIPYISARVRGTYGGNICNYEGATSSNTAEYPLIKTLFSAVLHDVKHVNPNTKFINLDMVDFYIFSPMVHPAYMCVPLKDIPDIIINKYNLRTNAHNGKAYFKVLMSMYGHPVAGRLANQLLWKTIATDGYYEDPLVPCLLRHKTRPVIGTVVVDDVGLKISSEDDLMHLVHSIEKVWPVKIMRNGNKFVGMDLKWNYDPTNPTLEITSNTVIPDLLKRFYPNKTLKGADTPGIPPSHWSISPDESEPLPCPEKTKFVQQFAGTVSHLARTVRHDLIPAVNEIAESQAAPTTKTMLLIDQLANYMARFPEGKVIFNATDMVLRCHYDSSLRPHGRHKAGGVIYHANSSDPPESIGNITEVICKLPTNCVASIAEGEYCAQFINGQAAYWHRVINEQMGYPQPTTKFYGDNTTAIGIANDDIKIKRSKGFDKAYHWFRDRARLQEFEAIHIASLLNGSDYQTKSLTTPEHKRQVTNYVKFPPANPNNPSLRASVIKKLFPERVC